MIISDFDAITFSAEMNADAFLYSKEETVIKKLPIFFTVYEEDKDIATEIIKDWEDNGYKVRKSLITKNNGDTCYTAHKQYTQEQIDRYNKERLKFMYYYIGERSSFQDAERIIREKCEEKGLDFDAIDPRSPHCFNDDHYCSLFCPYYKGKCSLTVEDFEKHGLQKQYYHLEKDYFLSQLHRGKLL